MGWFVYILECSDGSLYTGSTTDPGRRVEEHNAGRGSAYTRARLPVALVHIEELPDRSSAQAREACIKRMKRSRKKDLFFEKERARSGYGPFLSPE